MREKKPKKKMNLVYWIVATVILLASLAVGFYFLIQTSIYTKPVNVLSNIGSNGIQLTVAPLATSDLLSTFPNGDLQGAPVLNTQLDGSSTDSYDLKNYSTQFLQYDSNVGTVNAAHIWYHEQGFMAVQLGLATPQIQFYHIDASGKWVADNLVTPQYGNLTANAPLRTSIVSGSFAPALGIANENFYFAISYGVMYQLQSAINSAQHLYGYRVKLFSCPAPSSSNVSNTSFTWTELANEIKHPFTDAIWDYQNPWIGAFGQKIQFTLDNTGLALKQCIYISGTQHDASQPGGSLFMYILSNNSATNPDIKLQQMIKDIQLVRNRSDPNLSNIPSSFPDALTMTYSFACSDFLVYTPIQDSQGFNFLLVGNASKEDPSFQKIYQNGYVQGYVMDKNTGRWVQGDLSLILTSSSSGIPFRLSATQANGFGSSIQYISSRQAIVVGDSSDNMPNTLLRLFLYQVTVKNGTVNQPTVTPSNTPKLIFNMAPDLTKDVPSNFENMKTYSVYPSNMSMMAMYRTQVFELNVENDDSTVILISGATSNPMYARPLLMMKMLPDFSALQVISKFYLSTFQIPSPILIFSSNIVSTVGYAQSIFVGYSRTKQTRFILFNNPYQQSVIGSLTTPKSEVVCLVGRVV